MKFGKLVFGLGAMAFLTTTMANPVPADWPITDPCHCNGCVCSGCESYLLHHCLNV
jgi:hypothetical protein